MFRHDGTDKNGLDLWIRLRGTVRSENVHSRMRVALPPWGVGAKTAHWLLVCLSHRYNVNAEIKRLGKHDFGHPWHSYVDRKQIRIQEIYDAVVYPSHANVSQFQGIPNFVAVGIGPLSHSDDYISQGPPDACLKGDILFVAKQMGMTHPPLPISHPQEKAMYNNFRESHQAMTTGDEQELAKLFKTKANGTTIMPKLPSMIHQYGPVWKRNNEIKLAKQEMKESLKEVLRNLTADMVDAPLMQDDGDLGEVPEDSLDPPPVKPVQMYVPPICAPGQSSYVPVDPAAEQTQYNRDCFYAPFCCLPGRARQCGGWKDGQCNEINSGRVSLPTNWQDVKREHKKKDRATQTREKRNAEKEKKKRQKLGEK